MSEADDRQWHLDKKVPLALIMTIIGQTVVAAWGASNLWTRCHLLFMCTFNALCRTCVCCIPSVSRFTISRAHSATTRSGDHATEDCKG
jgi:hypothetical protein